MPKLTKSAIDSTAPGAADIWLWDTIMPGFGVRIQPSGRKTYVLRYRTHDRQQRKLTIGRCTDLTPDQARELARKAMASVAGGDDPAKKRKEMRDAPTVADLADRYMRLHSRPYKKPNSIRHDERNWRLRILPAIGRKKVESVTHEDALELHSGMAETPAMANHVRALLSHSMNLAIKWGWRRSANPCIGVPRFRIRQRETVLTPDQLGAMDAALTRLVATSEIGRQYADLFRLLALTGCRLGEIMKARREWVDVERRLLLLPDSKVGQRRIDLPSAAVEIVKAMPPAEWLIPGKIRGRHLLVPYYVWSKVKKEAGLPMDTRIHDLRHTFGSLGHRSGLSQRQIADMLGHSDTATTQRYIHGLAGDRARAVDTVADVVSSGWSK